MEAFEVHITGSESILKVAASYGIKAISVNLLRPDGSIIRTEHMTSQRMKHKNFEDCKKYVLALADKMREEGVAVLRVKIETPYYEHYTADSLYLESHFETNDMTLPVSQNARKTTLLATDRTYEIAEYESFVERYKDNAEVELCLYDDYIGEDADWFAEYEAFAVR